MKSDTIAAQLYTVRDFLKTPKDMASSFARIKAIGFDTVQVSGIGPIETQELKRMLDGEGLRCCATHEPGKDILGNPEAVVERLKILECFHTAYPYPHTAPKTAPEYRNLAAALDRSGALLRKAGIALSYHNHAIEFERFGDRTGLEIILENASALNLMAEIDTFWVQYGGQDPSAWCRKLANRLPLLHLKDYGIVENKHRMFEVGRGNLDWKSIVGAARQSGTEWFIIEQDECAGDPFDSLKISLEYLLALD